jgi:hypothetical protein
MKKTIALSIMVLFITYLYADESNYIIFKSSTKNIYVISFPKNENSQIGSIIWTDPNDGDVKLRKTYDYLENDIIKITEIYANNDKKVIWFDIKNRKGWFDGNDDKKSDIDDRDDILLCIDYMTQDSMNIFELHTYYDITKKCIHFYFRNASGTVVRNEFINGITISDHRGNVYILEYKFENPNQIKFISR